MTPEQITKIVEALLTILGIIVSAYVIPWIKTKINAEKLEQLKQFCEQAVRSAEQIYTPDENKLKKAYVQALINEYVEKLGLGINEAEVEAVIEGVVNHVKHNKTGA